MTDRRLAAVWLLSVAMLTGVVVAHAVHGTTAYLTDSNPGSFRLRRDMEPQPASRDGHRSGSSRRRSTSRRMASSRRSSTACPRPKRAVRH